MKKVIKGHAIFALLCGSVLALAGCSGVPGAPASSGTLSSSSAGAVAGKVSVTVADSSGAVIFSDASVSTSQSLNLVSGRSYVLNLSQANSIAGSTYTLVLTQTNVVSGTTSSIPLKLGANTISVPTQGDYSLKIVATPPSGAAASAYYLASVSCASPTLTAASLDASKISVSSSGTNMFTLSSSGVTASANGTAPYQCAWDPTGTGIQDTGFASCDTPVANFYSNFLGSRKVGLIVKDACNSTFAISNSANFVSAEPAMPGNNFISAQTSYAAGSAVGDSRLDGVNYLATNAGGNQVVFPNYSRGAFQIISSLNYGRPSSVKFGMQIQIKGLTDSIDLSTASGSISAASASVAKVVLSTDQAGDSRPAVTLSGSSCTLSNQGASVAFVTGQPCGAGMTGDNNRATVEVWGHYSCTGISTSGASVNIQGDFDGKEDIADNCVGGGGGGGGGVQPVGL